jgi:hypothetical protein
MKIKAPKLKRNLGVSTVIANMFMITITIALAAILVGWAANSYGLYTGGSQQYFVQRQQAMEERFTIENVFFNKSQRYIDIFVRNVGVTNVTIVAIYTGATLQQPTGIIRNGAATCTIPSKGLILGVRSSCDFNLQLNNGFNSNCPTQPWCSGDIFYIVVASGKGNQATYTGGAP